jgi:hypothetical protein
MSESTNLERTILVTSATNNFLLNRDPEEYLPVLEDIFVSYTTTDEFACLSPEERMNLVNCYKELKIFLKALVRLRKPQEVIVP